MIATCDKTGFTSQAEANRVAIRIAKGHRRMRSYFCKTCRAWHLTSGNTR